FRGLHWDDTTADYHHGVPFTNSLIYNTYRGKLFAFEPMITRAHLLTNPDTLIAIKQAHYYRKTGDYPQNYKITYDASNQTYNVVMRDFEPRIGNPTNPFVGISNGMFNGISLGQLYCGSTIPGSNNSPL